MATGTVKWFNATKGFGFIQPDAGGPDVFVHISAVERAGMHDLKKAEDRLRHRRRQALRQILGGQFEADLKMASQSLRRSDAISVRELAHMRSTGTEHMVLDVREARELDICQLEGGLHIPMAEIPARVDDLPTNQPLVVLCHHGARSQMVVDFLRDAGFDNAVNLDGGIEAWACEIDRSMRRYR